MSLRAVFGRGLLSITTAPPCALAPDLVGPAPRGDKSASPFDWASTASGWPPAGAAPFGATGVCAASWQQSQAQQWRCPPHKPVSRLPTARALSGLTQIRATKKQISTTPTGRCGSRATRRLPPILTLRCPRRPAPGKGYASAVRAPGPIGPWVFAARARRHAEATSRSSSHCRAA